MYGKHHTEEARKKISETLIKNQSCKGKNNSQHGISPKDRMDAETYSGWKEKHREQMTGANNPQYGVSPYKRISPDKIAKWKEHLSESCRDELNGNAKKIRMHKNGFSMDFAMLKRCAQYICENGLSKGTWASVSSNIGSAAKSGETYLGFYFDYIK